MDVLWLMAGGAMGTWARWAVGRGMTSWLGAGFPYGTLAVNVAGSLLLALFLEHTRTHEVAAHWRLAVATGFCGGFTTYSTFNADVLRQLEAGAWGRALGYMGVTVVVCLAAGVGGIALARAWGR